MSICPFRVDVRGRGIRKSRPPLGPPSFLARSVVLLLGGGAFIATWTSFACFIIFLGNLPRRAEPWIEPSADAGVATDWTASIWGPVLINLALLALFGLQHSGMARPRFKAWLTRRLPIELERTAYVYAACAVGFFLLILWQPIPIVVWHIDDDALRALAWAVFISGWLMLLTAALSIDMLELVGLKQCWGYFTQRSPPAFSLKTGAIYHWLAHPMYVGLLLGVWCAPHMTVGHMLMALGLTAYIAIGRVLEERDLAARFGTAYAMWRQSGHPAAPAESKVVIPHRCTHTGQCSNNSSRSTPLLEQIRRKWV